MKIINLLNEKYIIETYIKEYDFDTKEYDFDKHKQKEQKIFDINLKIHNVDNFQNYDYFIKTYIRIFLYI